jgi:hypothetical protein
LGSISFLCECVRNSGVKQREADEKSEVRAESRADFVLTIKDDPISLNANDASNRLSTSYAYVWNSVKEGGKITKIVLLPNGHGTVLSRLTTKKSKTKAR